MRLSNGKKFPKTEEYLAYHLFTEGKRIEVSVRGIEPLICLALQGKCTVESYEAG